MRKSHQEGKSSLSGFQDIKDQLDHYLIRIDFNSNQAADASTA